MRILLLVHDFNSLSQRLFVELARDGHELSVEFDIHEGITREAVKLFRPELILAPFLKRAIPAPIWQRCLCLIVHPGPPGDRGPSALDWAILKGVRLWGVTVLQATAEFDAGPVWASSTFAMRSVRKSSLYHSEVTEAAVGAVRAAIARVQAGAGPLTDENRAMAHGWQPPMRQADRAIDWVRDHTATILRKIHSADGSPGLSDLLFNRRYRLFDASAESELRGVPGTLIARRHHAICRATRNGAVWIGHLQAEALPQSSFKLPAILALGGLGDSLPWRGPDTAESSESAKEREIRYEERGAVGYLHFDFYNGALSAAQGERLRCAFAHARRRSTRVIVLMGGAEFWCNGMHLHCIEAAASPADASWSNINVIDDLARDILLTETHLTIAALQGNTAAGGVFLALAADRVLARSGIVLNPHYRNMGNLFGSEYWTYLLPKRVGAEHALALMTNRLPVGVPEAYALGLVDAHAGPDTEDFNRFVASHAQALATGAGFAQLLKDKGVRRAHDERRRPLADYRAEELEHMRMNFYGFDPSYHIARHRFVHRRPRAWTPLHLARHRRAEFLDQQAPALA